MRATPDQLPTLLGLGHAVLAAACIGAAAGLRADDRRDVVRTAVGAALAVLVGARLGPLVPTAWLSPVREGFTEAHVEAVAGVGLHAGPLVRAAWAPLLLPDPPTLRDVVGLDLGATVAVAWALARTARRWVGPGFATLLALVWLVAPSTWSSAFGETEAPIVTLYGLLALPAFGLLGDRASPPRAAAAAVGVIVLSTVLGAAGRPEVLALGGAALGAGLLARRPLGTAVDTRAARAIDAALAHPLATSLGVLGWIAVAERLLPVHQVDLRTWGQATWAWYAASPLDDRALTLLPLLGAALPLGLVALGAVGAVRALRAPVAHAALPLVLLWWQGTWWLAAHGGLHGQARGAALGELWRYVLLATPWVVLLAARGLALLRPRAPVPLLVAVLLLPPVPAVLEGIAGDGTPLPLAGPVVSSAAQEVRALVHGVAVHPGCTVVARGQPWDRRAAAGTFRWSALVGQRAGLAVRHAELPADAAPAAVLDALQVGPGCVLAWQGLDCAATGRDGAPLGADGCGPLPGWPALDVRTTAFVPWVHPAHGLRWSDPITTGFRRFPGRTSSP